MFSKVSVVRLMLLSSKKPFNKGHATYLTLSFSSTDIFFHITTRNDIKYPRFTPDQYKCGEMKKAYRSHKTAKILVFYPPILVSLKCF